MITTASNMLEFELLNCPYLYMAIPKFFGTHFQRHWAIFKSWHGIVYKLLFLHYLCNLTFSVQETQGTGQ